MACRYTSTHAGPCIRPQPVQGTEIELPLPLNADPHHCRYFLSDLVPCHCCRLGRVHQRAGSSSAAPEHLQQSITSGTMECPEENSSRRPTAPARPRLERRVLLSQVALLGLLGLVQKAGAQQVEASELWQQPRGSLRVRLPHT